VELWGRVESWSWSCGRGDGRIMRFRCDEIWGKELGKKLKKMPEMVGFAQREKPQ
jgi:hypothetical protein